MQHFSHQTVRLAPGRHTSPDEGVCVMELASVLAGEPFSDHPRSVSPTIAALLRGYNDGLDDARRQTLKRFAASTVGTKSNRGVERERRREVRVTLRDAASTSGVRLGGPVRASGMQAYAAARLLGDRVAATGDDRLHARVLDLVDRLVALGGVPAVDGEPVHDIEHTTA